MKDNPNINVEVEAVSGSIEDKQKIYMASNEPIDITMVHGSADLNTLVMGKYVKEINLNEPTFLQAANLMKQLMDIKMFQDAYMTAEYGASQNLFTQEKAAMWYMGSWESGMGQNEKLSESFRKNLGVLRFPVVEGGKGKVTIFWVGMAAVML